MNVLFSAQLYSDVFLSNRLIKVNVAPPSGYTCVSCRWSFGIVLWEIVTLGNCPYPGIGNQQLCRMLQDGYRMEKPDSCPEPMYVPGVWPHSHRHIGTRNHWTVTIRRHSCHSWHMLWPDDLFLAFFKGIFNFIFRISILVVILMDYRE